MEAGTNNSIIAIKNYHNLRANETKQFCQFFRGRTILVIRAGQCEIKRINFLQKLFKKLFKPQEERIMTVLTHLNREIKQLNELPEDFMGISEVHRFKAIWKCKQGYGELFETTFSMPKPFGAKSTKKPGPFLEKLRSRPLFVLDQAYWRFNSVDNFPGDTEREKIGDDLLQALENLTEDEELSPLDLATMSAILPTKIVLNLRKNDKWLDEYLPKLSPPALKIFAHLTCNFPVIEILWKHMDLKNVFRILKEKIGREGRAAFISAIPVYEDKSVIMDGCSYQRKEFLLFEMTRFLKISGLLIEKFDLCAEIVADLPDEIQKSFYSNLLGLAAGFLGNRDWEGDVQHEKADLTGSMQIVDAFNKVPQKFRKAVLEKMILTDRLDILFALLCRTKNDEQLCVKVKMNTLIYFADYLKYDLLKVIRNYPLADEFDEVDFKTLSTAIKELNVEVWQAWITKFSKIEKAALIFVTVEREYTKKMLASPIQINRKVSILRQHLRRFNLCRSDLLRRERGSDEVPVPHIIEGIEPLLEEEYREIWLDLAKDFWEPVYLSDLILIARVIDKNQLLVDLLSTSIERWGIYTQDNENKQFVAAIISRLSLKAQRIHTRDIFIGCLYSDKANDFELLESFDDQIWEEAFAKLDPLKIPKNEDDKYASRKSDPFRFMLSHPHKGRVIFRGLLKNPFLHGEYSHNFVDKIGYLNYKQPMEAVRSLGADVLLHFPWILWPFALPESKNSDFLELVLADLDMNIESDRAILHIMAQSPLCVYDPCYNKIFLDALKPDQKAQLDVENVHEDLRLPLTLSKLSTEELYLKLIENEKAVVDLYKQMGNIHFNELFAYACDKIDKDKELPEPIGTIATSYFRKPEHLARLENPAHVLRAGRLLKNQSLYFDVSIFMKLFYELSKEQIGAIEQLLAERSNVLQGIAFNFQKMMLDDSFPTLRFVLQLAEKLDDPFLLLPLLCTARSPLRTAGPLSSTNRHLMDDNPSFFTALMKVLEEEPWKFALMLEVNSPFDVDSFIQWETKNNSLCIKLHEWSLFLQDDVMNKQKNAIDRALNEALKTVKYDGIAELLNQAPKVAEIYCAPILGPKAQTVAQRIGDYSQKQLLAALSTPAGKAKLEPHLLGLLERKYLSPKFKNWIAYVYELTKAPLFTHLTMPKENKEALFDNKEAEPKPDVTLKVGEKSFFVHKEILSGASEFFKTTLSKNFIESTTNEIELKEIDADSIEALEAVLRYMYSGEIPEFENVGSLVAFYEALNFLK